MSASAVVIHYEEALYQVYAPLRYLYLYLYYSYSEVNGKSCLLQTLATKTPPTILMLRYEVS